MSEDCPSCIKNADRIDELEASLKKVQGIAKAALDKLVSRWSMGYQAGMKQAIPYEKELTEALAAERKARKDDNADITSQVLELESELSRYREGVTITARVEGWCKSDCSEPSRAMIQVPDKYLLQSITVLVVKAVE